MLKTRIGQGLSAGAAMALAGGLLLGAFGGAAARAQNALGDGRALEANPLQGSGGRNSPGRDLRAEIALRNAIVTGNVGGGRSFRGNVGYTATDDFRGTLGSNDLFIWNRESTYSGLAAQNIQGIDGLKFQLGQSTAGLTRGFGGDLIIRRSGTGINSGDVIGTAAPQTTATIDPFGRMRASLRSTSDFLVQSFTLPSVLTALEGTQANQNYLTASPLQGVKVLGINNSALGLTLDQNDLLAWARDGQLGDSAMRAPGAAQRGDAEEDGSGASRTLSQRVQARTVHQQLLEDMEGRQKQFQPDPVGQRLGEKDEPSKDSAGEKNTKPDEKPGASGTEGLPELKDDSLEGRLEQLRKEFASGQEMPWQRSEREQREALEAARNKQDMDRLREKLDPTNPLAAANDVRMAEDEDRSEIETLIRKARETLGNTPAAIDTLVAEEGTSDLYTVHMRKGQTLLLEEKWFSAEERFAAALRARPGDVMAAAGRISAELGAGLYRSAAINLRTMLTAYPEMIQTRFDPKLFPSGERLDRVRAQLRLRSELDTPVARDVGFLLAYVGAQTGNKQDMVDGFAIMRRVDKTLDTDFDKLENVVWALWLNP